MGVGLLTNPLLPFMNAMSTIRSVPSLIASEVAAVTSQPTSPVSVQCANAERVMTSLMPAILDHGTGGDSGLGGDATTAASNGLAAAWRNNGDTAAGCVRARVPLTDSP